MQKNNLSISIKNLFIKTMLGFLMVTFVSFAQTNTVKKFQDSDRSVKNNHLKKTGYALINGLQLYYEIYGNGDPTNPHPRYIRFDRNVWSIY